MFCFDAVIICNIWELYKNITSLHFTCRLLLIEIIQEHVALLPVNVRYVHIVDFYLLILQVHIYGRFLPVDVIQVHVGQEVGGQWGGVVQALNGGIHVACVTKVTETCERPSLERRPKSVRIT